MVTAKSQAETGQFGGWASNSPELATPMELVLCAVEDDLVTAWEAVAGDHPGVRVHRGCILDVGADCVVSPANSYGWMRGGVDAVYAQAFPAVEQSVRSAVLAFHGGELPVGEALIVPTGASTPAWLISSPTIREPGTRLPPDTVHPYLAARAAFRLWRGGVLEDGIPVRVAVGTLALPGLGTGIAGVAPATCARQVIAAWTEVMAEDHA